MRPSEFLSPNKASITGDEMTASVAALLGPHLRKNGVDERKSDEIALALMGEIRLCYGGQLVYFARSEKVDRDARNEEIYDRFMRNEVSVSEIAAEYGHSLQWAYKVIRTVRANRKAERDEATAEARAKSMERWEREGGNGVDA